MRFLFRSDPARGAIFADAFVEALPEAHTYWTHPKVILTPHIASVTQLARAARIVIENLKQHRAGLDPIGLVNRCRGYSNNRKEQHVSA